MFCRCIFVAVFLLKEHFWQNICYFLLLTDAAADAVVASFFYLFAANAQLADEFLCYCSTVRFLQLPAESVVIVARSFICQCLDLVLNRLTCVHVICLLPAAQLFWFIRVLYKFQCASSTLTSMLINEIIQTILKWLMTFELCALKCAFKWRIVKLFILLLCKCMAIFFFLL